MSFLVTILFLLLNLWLLSTVALLLHRLSPRTGLTPMLIYLSSLTIWLLVQSADFLQTQHNPGNLGLHISIITFLPVILLGILTIYIFDGTTRARIVIASLAGTGILAAGYVLMRNTSIALQPVEISIGSLQIDAAGDILSFTAIIALDFLATILIYQLACNFLHRTPSVLAGMAALLIPVMGDTLLSALLFNHFALHLGDNLVIRSLLVAALLPLLAIYLRFISTQYSSHSAAISRPTFDIFSTSSQIEARAHFHYNLLRTLSQVNRMILDTADPLQLLRQATQLLVMNRNHQLVWVGLLDPGKNSIGIYAWAGQVSKSLRQASIDFQSNDGSPYWQAIQTASSYVIPDLRDKSGQENWHHPIIQENSYRSMGCFPMRQSGQVIGLLNVYSHLNNAFDPEEIDLLQELADNLAFALINIEARQQQAVLHAGAETMEDGLLIMDDEGKILYANPSVAITIGKPHSDLIGSNFRQFIPNQSGLEEIEGYYQVLMQQGKANFDYEYLTPEHGLLAYSISTHLVHHGENTLVVVNLRDVSRRRQYERQLVTLNQFLTDMVQAQEIPVLMEKLFTASEELLQADASAMYIADEDQLRIVEYYSHNLPDSFVEFIRDDIRGLPGQQVLKTNQPVLISDTSSDAAFSPRVRVAADHGLMALMILPITFQETAIGTLVMYFHSPRQFQQQELQLGMTLARALGILTQNLRLFAAEHHQRQFAEALAQAATAVNSSLELEHVLDRILDQALRVVHCRSVNLMLIEGDHARVVRMLDTTNPNAVERTSNVTVALSMPTLREMIDTGQPLIIPDTTSSSLWRNLSTTSWVRSYAAAPLHVRDQIIGFLSMNSDEANFFSGEIRPRLEAFAATVASALQNARLYAELRQYSQELEDRVHGRTAELADAKERIESILVSVPDAVFVLNSEDKLVQCNPAAENLIAAAERTHIDLFSREFLTGLRLGSLREERAILEVGERAYQAVASGLPGQETSSELVVVLRDVTRFREIDQMKTRFVSDVSHELRTPLTNLALYIDLLANVSDPARGYTYKEALRRETQRLTHLIEDLLTISRLEADKMDIEMQPVDAGFLVANLVEDRAPMAASQSLDLSHSCYQNTPDVWADPRLLTQVVSNLLTNALNYTQPGGKIHIRVSHEPQDHNNWVTIQVIDTGVGIPPDETPNLFTRFFRGSASEMTGAPGTGLGLAISKELSERMGGHITMQSEPGKGSTFSVWLRAVL